MHVIDHKVITDARRYSNLLGKVIVGDLHVGEEVVKDPAVLLPGDVPSLHGL